MPIQLIKKRQCQLNLKVPYSNPIDVYSQEYPVNAGVLQGSILGSTLFLLYINDLPDDVICNIAISADDTTLYDTTL